MFLCDLELCLPQPVSRLHILFRTDLQDLRPDDPGKLRPMSQRHSDHHAFQPPPQHKRDQDQQDQMGHTHAQVDAPVYKTIQPPADHSRRHPSRQRDQGTDGWSQHTDHDTGGESFHTAQQHIPSHEVSPKEMPCAGR